MGDWWGISVLWRCIEINDDTATNLVLTRINRASDLRQFWSLENGLLEPGCPHHY